jgi:hypothetical protein
MMLKQAIYEDEKVLNSSSRADFYAAVKLALLPLLDLAEREMFLSMAEEAQEDYMSGILSGVRAIKA